MRHCSNYNVSIFPQRLSPIEFARSVKWKLHLLMEAGKLVRNHGYPRIVLWFRGGVGDHLLCTAIARELRKRQTKGIWMVSPYAELYETNNNFDAVLPDNGLGLEEARMIRAWTLEPRYAPDVPGEDRQASPGCHIIAKMCQMAGIRGEVELRPYLELTDGERLKGKRVERQIVIQSSNTGALRPANTKQWYPERFQAVVDQLKGEYNFVQLGSLNEPPLAGTIDLRGKTALRETAAILAGSLMLVGLEGMLMHLARAVECPSVIVFGGRLLPSETGYSANENLYVPMPCSPCWKYNSCEINRECMQRISVDDVIKAIRRKAGCITKPLAIDRAWIS
jgi:hypothetical protein